MSSKRPSGAPMLLQEFQKEIPKTSRKKASPPGVSVKIRYLPPGMKEYEVERILGDEWKAGNGNVIWSHFDRGKAGRPEKPCKPGTIYLRIAKEEDMQVLAEFVKNAVWEDNAESFNDPSLLCRPFVERNFNQLDRSAKGRLDSRMGTIDTDPEFMRFLDSLTNPEPLRGDEQKVEETEDEKNTAPPVTPLIEHIRSQKANKEKEAAQAKSAKGRQEAKVAKGKGPEDPKKVKDKAKDKEKAKAEKPEPVKILTKRDATDAAVSAAKNAAKQIATAPAAEASSAPAPSELPKNRRAGIAAAAKILQRDLGLSPGTAHRRARQDAAKADASSKSTGQENPTAASGPATTSKATASSDTQQPSTPTQATATPSAGQLASPAPPKSSNKSRRGVKHAEKGKAAETAPSGPTGSTPVILKKKPAGPASQSTPSASATSQPQNPPAVLKAAIADLPKSVEKPKPAASASQKKTTAVTPGATRGFVKHANPSQGVTEALLKEALGQFGTVTFVEIDKRKGFAYVDFANHEDLVKAVAESPVTVAQANIMVLERRDKKPAQGAAAAAGPAASSAENGQAAAGPSDKATGSSRRRRGKGGDKANGSAGQAGQTAAASGSASKSTG